MEITIKYLKMENNYAQEEYLYARKKVESIRGFYGNLIAYIIVNLGLLILNLITTPNHIWFFWPMLGWGIGVAIHAAKVFEVIPFFGKNWEERKIQEIINKQKNNHNAK